MAWPQEIVTKQKVSTPKLTRAKKFRHDMTAAEAMLWSELRDRKVGVHFRRQQVIAGYIVDFYAHSYALVIEVDGSVHDAQVDADEKRTNALEKLGLTILRFTNDEVLEDLPAVLKRVIDSLHLKHSVGSPSL